MMISWQICWWLAYIHICLANIDTNSHDYDADGSAHFITHKGFFHKNENSKEYGLNGKLNCARICAMTRDCCSYSFSETNNKCRLSALCVFSTDIVESDAAWSIMTRKTALCQVTGPSVTDQRDNRTPYSSAAPLCAAYAGELAAPSHVQEAYDTGMHRYRWGWVNDGTTRSSAYGGCMLATGSLRPLQFCLRDGYQYMNRYNIHKTISVCVFQPLNMAWKYHVDELENFCE